MPFSTSVTQQHEQNRDIARINRHAHEVKGTLNINMCKSAQLKLSTILVEALGASSPNAKKRKLEEAISVNNDLATSIINSKRNFQDGGHEMRRRANDNASYEQGNLNRCILNGKDPASYKGIENFDHDMIQVYSRLNFGRPCSFPSPPISGAPPSSPDSTSSPTTKPSLPVLQNTIPIYTVVGKKVLDITPPSVAIYYSPHEIKTLLKRIEDEHGKYTKGSAVAFVLKNEYVPVKKSAFYDKMKKDTNENTEWFQIGRPALINAEEVAEYIVNMKDGPTNGNTMAASFLYDLIKRLYHKNCVEEHGMKECDVKELSNNTIYRVANKVRASDKFNIFKNVSNKTDTRYAAENSERSTIAYSLAVAVSHFIKAPFRKDCHTPYNDMTKGSKLMFDLVKSQHPPGTSLVNALPQLITTTDELTVFATVGKVSNKEDYYITIKPERGTTLPSSQTRSNYTTTPQGDLHCRGVRIVINNTFSASGQVAPIAATIYGLSPKEMPGGDDIVAIPIPGLVRGADQNNDETKGLLVFVRGNVDVEKETFTSDDQDKQVFSKDAQIAKLYRQHIYYPFIERQRKWLGHTKTHDVPDYLRAVSWQDGCDGQLKLVTSEDSLEEDVRRNIMACKQSAARTTTEQSADVGSCFKAYRKFQKDMSVKDNDFRNRGLVMQIEKAIRERIERNELNLETFKFNAIVHLISKTPSCQSETYTFERISKGFIRNGQISTTRNSPVPDIMGCLGTLRYEYPDKSEKHLQTLFDHFYPIMHDNGHIEEADYDELDIRMDTNSKGDIVSKHALTIRSENRQRAKIMSSKKQRTLRLEERERRNRESQRIVQKNIANEEKIYKRNKDCEELLIKHMKKGKPDDYVPCLIDVTESMFGVSARSGVTPTKGMMVSFIQVRSERHLQKNGGVKYIAGMSTKSRQLLVNECMKLKDSSVSKPLLKAAVDDAQDREGDEEQMEGGVTL
jgi:hypothetical protein